VIVASAQVLPVSSAHFMAMKGPLGRASALDTQNLDCRATATGVSVLVRVKPRASKSRVLGVREGYLEVSLAAAPVDGKANDALRQLLAETFGVPVRAVTIIRGQLATKKHVEITGLGLAEVRARLSSG
jgi:uncharacterized protein (TIGR00251 family)